MASICRLCATLKKIELFVSIFDEKLSLKTKLEKCCQVAVDEDDPLPKNVCRNCVTDLDESWKFYLRVQDAQDSLFKIFCKDNIKATDGGQESNIVQKLTNPVESHAIIEEVQEDNIEIIATSPIIEKEDIDEAEEDTTIYEIAVEDYDEQKSAYSDEEEIGEVFLEETCMDDIKPADAEYSVQYWFNYPWSCAECDETFATFIELKTHHTNAHDAVNLKYVCADCSKLFEKYYSFINHVKTRHRRELNMCCDVCSDTYQDSASFATHRATHDDCLVTCATCAKLFKNINALQIHERCHQPDNMRFKFTCEICKKKFCSKPNLKAHQKIHTGVKENVCYQCGKAFVQKANLEEHLLTHINQAPFECTSCDKRFKTPARLTKHQLVHTDHKPFKCETCGRLFREKDTLKVHSRIHTGEMPYSCDICNKKFRFKSVLTTHRYQHTGERPYSCLECNHHFTNWPNYNKHMKRRHGINTSNSIRKPQDIPPTGMPPNAKNQYQANTDNSNNKSEFN